MESHRTVTVYNVLLKNGGLRYFQKAPKKTHVIETITHLTACGDTQNHELTHSVTGEKKTTVTRCGYDRGVKLPNLIKSILS